MADSRFNVTRPVTGPLSQRLKGIESDPDGAYFYPNRGGRIVLKAIEDVVGRHGVNAILNLADLDHYVNNFPPNNLQLGFTFNEFGRMQETIELMFGRRAGRGLSQRAGRETFKYLLKDFMPVMGIADLATRALPMGIKMKIGLNVFAESFNKLTDQVVRLGEDSARYLWIIERCPICWGRQTEAPCCHLAVGVLEQSLFWLSNGKRFHIVQESCRASGDEACLIAINKKPLHGS